VVDVCLKNVASFELDASTTVEYALFVRALLEREKLRRLKFAR
jgi:hypothetical protein